jgi:hypothetical protein
MMHSPQATSTATTMRPPSSFFSELLLCLLLLLSSTTTTTAFRYQVDTSEDCADKLDECTTSDTVWFQCPISCNDPLHQEGTMFEVHDDPQQIFSDLSVMRSNGKILSLEDYEGYVTLYAVVPLLPGMAQFYYELLEHVQAVYPYTVQTLIEPYITMETTTTSITITPHDEPKTILLEPAVRPTQVLDYMLNAPQVAGNPDTTFKLDRVTIWLISADGMFLERLNSPSMSLLERRVAVFLKQMAWTPEL